MTSHTALKIPNMAKTTAVIWWILGVLFFIGIFTPAFADLFDAETENWMFATMFFSIVLCATSFVVAVMYTKRARVVTGILRQENLLVHWTYTKEEWSLYAKKEHLENKRYNMNLFWLVTVIAVIIGVIFIIGKPKDWIIFAGTVLGIIFIAGFSAWLAVVLKKRQNLNLGEAYITKDAVYLNRELHLWKGFGAALEEAGYQGTARAVPVINIEYSVPARSGRQSVTVRVPVPRGREEEAQWITAQLQNQLSVK